MPHCSILNATKEATTAMKLPVLAVPLVFTGIDAALANIQPPARSNIGGGHNGEGSGGGHGIDCGNVNCDSASGPGSNGRSHGSWVGNHNSISSVEQDDSLGITAGCCSVVGALAGTVLDLAAAAAHSPAWLAAVGDKAFAEGRASLRGLLEKHVLPTTAACLKTAAGCGALGLFPSFSLSILMPGHPST